MALAAVALLFALPLLVMLFSSLKTPEELARNPWALLPQTWRWQNYPDALSTIPYWRHLFNSLLLCTGCVIGTTLSCSLVAWSLSQIHWRGRQTAFVIVIATMLLPWQITMVPRFVLISAAGLYDSLWSIILPTFLGEAFFIFLLRQFFLTLPRELLEAGRVDGLGDWGLFWRIGLPLSKPALATVAVFQFVYTWNDFSGPLLYLNDPEKFPLAYGLERFVSAYGDQTHLLLAASVMFTVPMILLFFLAQRTFIQGISTTGLKG
jgi:multiple sugar transport system permease protein